MQPPATPRQSPPGFNDLLSAMLIAAERSLKPKALHRFQRELGEQAQRLLREAADRGNVYPINGGGVRLHETPQKRERGEVGAAILSALGEAEPPKDAASIIAGVLDARPAEERGRILREFLAHSAAGLVVVEGREDAAEATYRLADAVVARGAAST